MTSTASPEPPPPPALRRAARASSLLPHPARWTLRRRLVLSVVGLLALASIIIGTVSVLALQGFLVGRLDSQLTATTGRSRQVVGEGPEVPQTPRFLTLPGQRPGMLGAVITDGAVFAGVLEASGLERPLSAAQVSQLLSLAPDGKPVTVSLGGSLGDYRVAVNQIRSNVFLVTGLPMGDVQATLLQLVVVIAIVTAAALAAAAAGGTLIVRLALRPLSRVKALKGIAEMARRHRDGVACCGTAARSWRGGAGRPRSGCRCQPEYRGRKSRCCDQPHAGTCCRRVHSASNQ